MDPGADYLARAVEAESQAARGTGTFRVQLLGLAELWRDMARKAVVLAELEQMLARGDLEPTAPVINRLLEPSSWSAVAREAAEDPRRGRAD